MTILIREHLRLYSGREQEGPAVPQTELPLHQLQHRSLGAWISEEDLQSCPPSNPEQELHSSASSLDAKLCAAVSPNQTPNLNPGPKLGSSSAKGETLVSPSKQGKTAPSWKYSFKSSSAPRCQTQTKQGSGGGAGGGSSGADATSVSSSGGNWLMNGLSSLRGHRRTSSGERSSRDSSGSSQRLSTYDNVTSSSSLGSVPSVSSTPWSTSSCEISVPDSTSEPSSERGRGPEGGEGPGGGTGTTASTAEPSSEQDSCEAMELCSSSDSGNAVSAAAAAAAAVLPVVVVCDEADAANASLGSLVEGLKDELMKQKGSYEARIHKWVSSVYMQSGGQSFL